MGKSESEIEEPGMQSYTILVNDTGTESYDIEVEGSVSKQNSLNLEQPDIPRFELNRSVTIANTGDTLVENPRIIVNGKRNWYDIDGILQEIITADMTDREKAFAIWNFVSINHYNANPAEDQDEIHDPVKYFNIYGYGVCDDAAKNLLTLWQAAGLKARLMALNGHVVSEVWFEGQYHVMDAYMQTFYLLSDNYTLASASQLADDNYLVRRTHHMGPYATEESFDNLVFASLYGPDDRELEFEPQSNHTMQFSLRPGETFEWRWDNIGKYHEYMPQSGEKNPPPYYANGSLNYTPDLSRDIYRKFLVKEKNIFTVEQDGRRPALHLASPENDGHILLEFSTPYVMVGGSIEARFHRPSTDDVVKVYISPDNVNWQRLWMATDETGDFEVDIPLDDWMAPRSSKAKYKYYLMIEFIGSNSRSKVGASYLSFDTDVQIAPVSLPALETGINHVEYIDDTDEIHQVSVTHHWLENNYNHPPEPPANPVSPENGEDVHQNQMRFVWQEARDEDGDPIWAYLFFLSEDTEIEHAYSPNFDRLVYTNEYVVPTEGLFQVGKRYAWRVRSLDKNGIWSEWSEPWNFIFHGPSTPENLSFIDEKTLHWEAGTTGTTPVRYEVYGSNENGFTPSEDSYEGITSVGADREVITNSGNLLTSLPASNTELQVIREEPQNENENKYFYRVIAVDSYGVKSSPAYVASPAQWIYTQPIETARVGEEYQYQPGVIYAAGNLQFEGGTLQPENEVLEFRIIEGPEWLKIDSSTGLLSGIPQGAQTGIEVQFEAYDQITNENSQQRYSLTVSP